MFLRQIEGVFVITGLAAHFDGGFYVEVYVVFVFSLERKKIQ
jgi:hypothetical protein